jgi:hypothetical protein
MGLLAGVAMMIISVRLSAVDVPEGLANTRAFESAADCPTVPKTPADCLWKQEFAVSGIRLSRGKRRPITATLTDHWGNEWPTEYRNDGPVLERLGDGDRVVGTIWRGQVVTIAARGTEQVTNANPTELAESALIIAIACGSSGLLLVIACAGLLRRPMSKPMACLAGLSIGLLLVPIFAALLANVLNASFWLIPGLWLPAAAVMTWFATRAARRPWPETATSERP